MNKLVRPRGRPTTPGCGKPSRREAALSLPLTAGQSRFIFNWMVRHNATRAYMDAYPNASYSTAQVEGSRLFRDPRISSEIRRLLEAQRERLMHDSDRVVRELAALAFSSVSDVMAEDGSLIPLTELPRDVAQAVKRIRRREIIGQVDGQKAVVGHMVEVEMHDKVQPLRLLGLVVGMFKERVEVTGEETWLAKLREGRKRALAG